MRPAVDGTHEPPVTLIDALRGHYMTGLVKVPLLVAAFWALGRWGIDAGLTLEEHLVAAVLGMLVSETVQTLIERPFVLTHDHPDPGDRLMAALLLVAPWPCWAVFLGLTQGGPAWTLAGATVAATIYAGFTLGLDEPWKEGLRREDVEARPHP